MIVDALLSKLQLFWQYPVITEKTFYNQNKHEKLYFGFPWATVIDKQLDPDLIYSHISEYLDKDKEYYSCCQHIHFRKMIPLWKKLNIKLVYIVHKQLNFSEIDDISFKACPLYAVNVEDSIYNSLFKKVDFLNIRRSILYSFVGGYMSEWYMSNIRPNIFKMKTSPHVIIENIGGWHFNDMVYGSNQTSKGVRNEGEIAQKRTERYNKILLNSRYSLCPSGSGPNSIRLWESLAVGAIPILLSDHLDLPQHELWEDSILRVKEDKLENIPALLSKISPEKEKIMRENCLKIYNHFKDNYRNE